MNPFVCPRSEVDILLMNTVLVIIAVLAVVSCVARFWE